MNEFIDPELGRMVAAAAMAGCDGCVYGRDDDCMRPSGAPACTPWGRKEQRGIIWVRAEDTAQKPKAVQLTDEQIITLRQTTRMLPGQWGDTKAFARAIEAAVLRANNLEVE